MPKVYAVKSGRQTGIFTRWEDVSSLVTGYSGAIFKSFSTVEEAKSYLNLNEGTRPVLMKPSPIELGTEDAERLIVYVDGSCSSKEGGYGGLFLQNGKVMKVMSGPVPIYPCTSQKAELFAIKMAIEQIEDEAIIRTDSIYSIKSLTDWINRWLENGWIASTGRPVENRELIEEIYYLLKTKSITFEHVRGHQGEVYNEMVDQLAKDGRPKH
jgi:ribonuclease HI